MRNSIIADNRFDAVSEKQNIYIGNNGSQGYCNIQVKGNIFHQKKLDDAVEVSALSIKDVIIKDNQLWSE